MEAASKIAVSTTHPCALPPCPAWTLAASSITDACNGSHVGDSRLYPGFLLAEETESVVVSIHYRLGALAWLGTDSLIGSGDVNRAFLDQQLALRWAQRNVAAFGGDPSRLLVFGQSAGGGSTAAQLLLQHKYPEEKLFSAAAMESPDTMDSQGECTFMTKETAISLTRQFAQQVGCGNLSTPSDERLIACLQNVSASSFDSRTPGSHDTFPMIDGMMFDKWPADSFRAGEFADVPIIIGKPRQFNLLQ